MARRRLKFRRPELRKARIEIIPMIDTIFFLLVFFLITSLTQTKMNGLAAGLPKDSPATPTKPTPKAVVTVDRAGDWFINTTHVAPTQMQPQLQQMIDAAPTTLIIVNIDKTRKVQEAITVMDAVNGVRLPVSAQTPESNAPAVMIATTPVDANGNAAPTATAAPSAPRGTP